MNAVVGLLVVFCSFLLLDSSHQVINLQNSLYSFEIPSLVTCSWFFLWNQNKKWNKKRFSLKSVIIYLKIFFSLFFLYYCMILYIHLIIKVVFLKTSLVFLKKLLWLISFIFIWIFWRIHSFSMEVSAIYFFFLLIILRYIDYW